MSLRLKIKIPLLFLSLVIIASAINLGIAGFAVRQSLTNDLLSRIEVNSRAEISDITNFVLIGDKESIVNLIFNQKASHKDVSYMLVMDENDQLLASTVLTQDLQKVIGYNVLPLGEEKSVHLITQDDGNVVYDIALRLDYDKGTFRVGYYKNQIDASILSVLYRIGIGSLLSILIAVFFAWFFTRGILKPLITLRDQANEVKAGNLGVRVDVNSGDEVGDVGIAFNEMTAKLVEIYAHLDEKVKEKTVELSAQVKETESRSEELKEKVSLLNALNADLDRNAELLTRRDTELTLANEKLRELDRTKSEFLSVAAHQLRTPLSAVKWIFSVLLEEHMGALSDAQKSYMLKGEASNNRMIRLVDDMLTVTRIESGRVDYHFYALSLSDIIGNIVADFQPRAAEAGLTLHFENTLEGVPQVIVDPEKIRFLFDNLLENALRYTPRGGTIHVRLGKDGEMFVVSFKDSGIGIPENEQKNIFMKFFRAANAVKTVTDGTGLGLFVAKSIVDRHEGFITFVSKPGEGTTFTVKLHPASSGIPSTNLPPQMT